jgi:glycosyltransferase involved in cell wall biosynthesis
MRPLVSVLTPSFNQGKWLPDNLASVRSQTYPHIEHLVMDGGSSDTTLAVLEASTGVKWKSEPDRGQSHALNKALEESRGEVVGWLNSDDAYFARDSVARAVDLFARRPEVSVLYGHAISVDAAGRIRKFLWAPPFSYALLRRYNFIAQPTVFFRRAAIESRFVDETFDYSMDRELWLYLAQRCRFARLHHLVALDRDHLERKTAARPDLATKDRSRLASRYELPRVSWPDARLRPLTLLFRALGLALVPRAPDTPAVPVQSEPRIRLALRQLFIRDPRGTRKG